MRINRVLQGQKAALRDITLEDAQQCVDWLADPSVTRYMITQAQTLESETEWIRNMLASDADLVACIMVPHDNGELRYVGNCGLHRIEHMNGTAEAGIFIGDASTHGRGIGQDVVRTLIAYAFQNLGLHKVWARVYGPNLASRTMCARAGLIEEGVLRSHRTLPEGRVDEHLFAAFVDTWM